MKRLTLIFAASVVLVSQAARADDSGIYVGAGVAAAGSLTACTNVTTTCNNFTAESQKSINPSLLLGYDVNRYFGIETGLMGLGTYKVRDTTGTNFVGTVKVSALTLAAKGGYKFQSGWSLFASLGLAKVWTAYTPGTGWPLTMNNHQSSSGIVAGLGAQYDFENGVGLRLASEGVSFSDAGYTGGVGAMNFLVIFKL